MHVAPPPATSASLQVPGAVLNYDIHCTPVPAGQPPRPLLLLISGGNGTAPIWHAVAHQLEPHFTAVSYDRRGFSRSTLVGDQDYSKRLERDADDAAALIHHLVAGRRDVPAYVVGTSSGAIVALKLLAMRPGLAEGVIAHEPPLVRYLDETERRHVRDGWLDVTKTYRTRGAGAAVDAFAASLGSGADAAVVGAALKDPRNAADFSYWIEHELNVYTEADLDAGTIREATAGRGKLIMAVGQESVEQSLHLVRISTAMSRDVGCKLSTWPGGHLGYLFHPADLALRIREDFLGIHASL